MNFDLTEEQQLLRDSAKRFVERSYTFEMRRSMVKRGGSFSRDTWQMFADMGWLGVAIAEECGGLGASAVEVAIIAEELGRGLVVEPYILCGVFPASLIRNAGSPQQAQDLLPAIATGESLVAVAHSEREARGIASHVATTAERMSDGRYRLSGRKTLVVGVAHADRLIVSARTGKPSPARGAQDEDGISLFLVDPGAVGVAIEEYGLVDDSRAGDVVLDSVVADALLGEEGRAYPALQYAVDEAVVALCAELVGHMEDTIAITAEYIKTRKQFGVPIGSFQVLQHRMADMAIELSQARAMLHRGLAVLANPAATTRSIDISGCKAQVTRSGRFVTAQGIQLHGGYGITEEYRVGHHFQRLLVADALFGNAEHHLNRYASWIQSSTALQEAAAPS